MSLIRMGLTDDEALDVLYEAGWSLRPAGATDCFVSPEGDVYWDFDEAVCAAMAARTEGEQ